MTEKNDTYDIPKCSLYEKTTAIGLATATVKLNPRPVLVRESGYTGKERLPRDDESLKIAALAQQINLALLGASDCEVDELLLTFAKEFVKETKIPPESLETARAHIERILKRAA